MTRHIALCATLALSGAAHAQFFVDPDVTATISLSWREDPTCPHNDNGVLEPGERAIITMSLSFTGQNSHRTFSPEIGPFSTGVVKGFAGAYLDITNASADPSGRYDVGVTSPKSASSGPNSNNNGTSGFGVRGGWRLGGNTANGIPKADGVKSIGPGQFPSDPSVVRGESLIKNLYRLGWTPADYTNRSATFTVTPNLTSGPDRAVSIYVDLDNGGTGGAVYIPLSQIKFGSVTIPVATSSEK